MSFKRLLFIMLIVIIGMFSLMLTTSYAWYSFEQGSTTFDGMTSNEDITISYQSGEYINTSIAVPISEADVDKYSEKSNFNIKVNNNKENNEILIGVSLTDVVIADELKDSNFKIDLYYQGTKVSGVDGSSIVTGTDVELGEAVLNNDLTNMFEIRVYILDNGLDQGAMMEKQFQGKIKIDVISRLKTSFEDFDTPDIYISSVTIDGKSSDSLPTSGYYSMSATCTKGSQLTWEPLSKTITYESGSYVNDTCSLVFTSSTDYPLLSEMPVGSYVAYVGKSGMVGETAVACQNSGPASSSTATDETEAPNSCLGENAREDIDTNGNTYGYCDNAAYKFTTTGWRIAYIDENKPVIISAGSPECNARPSSDGNIDYVKLANTKAMKYCNSDLVDGDCSCLDSNYDGYCDCTDSDDNGLCDEIENGEVDAWAVSDIDFYNMTKAISGVGKRLHDGSSLLGDNGGTLGTTLVCNGYASKEECGYNNDLIDNGGYYWFAARNYSISTCGLLWYPVHRYVYDYCITNSYGLRPVISLSSSVVVTGGAGTIDDPYQIEANPSNAFVKTVMESTAKSDKDIDFSQTSEESGTNGIYLINGTENDTYPIYYYRGAVDNNLIFANFCWKVVRTTETGGLKLIYNGVPTDGQCNNTGEASQIGTSVFNSNYNSPAYVGYMYGTPYVAGTKDMRSDTTAYIYGNDVSYSNGIYTLTDTITSSDWSSIYSSGLNNYHYTCLSTGTTCTNVYYIYYTDSSTVYYITLTDGKKAEDALSEMLDYNTMSSTIKGNNTTSGTLDYWYYTNIEEAGYGDYVEDTVWCNDRSTYSLGGWDYFGGEVTAELRFGAYERIYSTSKPSLSCERDIDKFTRDEQNGNGSLDYPVGLLTADEVMLAGGGLGLEINNVSYYLYTGSEYWTGSPWNFFLGGATVVGIEDGYLIPYSINSDIGVRPSISLKPGFSLTDDGDGTVSNPYVVN